MTVSNPQRQQQLQRLVARLGLPTTATLRWQLLDQALTHASVAPEFNYEQLEFVGDAVVRLAVAEFLQQHYPQQTVGEWSAIRSVLVSDQTLATLADCYGLERFLIVHAGAVAESTGQAARLAEAFEALLAALYLSSGDLALIRPWLDPHWQKLAETVRTDPAYQNYKAALQAWTQSQFHALPEYQVEAMPEGTGKNGSGKAGTRRFRAEVWFQGQCLGEGWGHSIKAAEKAAAEVAYKTLEAEQKLVAGKTVNSRTP